MAASECGICKKPIGYDTRFYVAPDDIEGAYVHAVCYEAVIENERQDRRRDQ